MTFLSLMFFINNIFRQLENLDLILCIMNKMIHSEVLVIKHWKLFCVSLHIKRYRHEMIAIKATLHNQ